MVIGLDSATLDLVRPWVEAGHLPNLGEFFARGAVGPLLSTLPPISAPAWSTFATGLNPGKHGILNFVQFVADSYEPRLVNASQRRGESFWEIAGRQGVRGGVINLPITYPPRPYNGFIITGMLSPGVSRRMASPPGVFDDLSAVSPDYAIDVDVGKGSGRQGKRVFLDRSLAILQARLEAALGLYRRHRPPLFCVVFTVGDRISHYFWDDMEALQAGRANTETEVRLGRAIQETYERLDEAVGQLVAEAGSDTDVLILSDHGAGPLRKGLSLHELLAQHGLLTRARTPLLRRAVGGVVQRLIRTLPVPVKSKIKAYFPALSRRAARVAASRDVDFTQAKAYPPDNSGSVFINVKGRQPNGIVEPGAEYEALRDKVIRILSELEDPGTGKRVAARVWRREEIWPGPCVAQMPDVILEQAERIYEIPNFRHPRGGEVFFDLAEASRDRWCRSGGHRREGLFMAMGPHIKHTEVRAANIADVPVTALALLGCAIPDDLDGRVLAGVLSDDVELPAKTAAGPDRESSRVEFSDEDQRTVEKRLEDLGYL